MKRKLAWTLAVIALAMGLTLHFGRTWIAQRLFDRALDQTVGVDQSAKLADGIHVYICGSGSPMPDAARAGPCIGVLAGQQAFVFDTGSGSIRKLGRMGFSMPKLQAAFLTHLHSDHIDGLGELLLQRAVGQQPEDYLFGVSAQGRPRTRQALHSAVRRVCLAAGVPVV